MKKNNHIDVDGNKNQIFQDIKNSSIDMSKKSFLPSESNWTVISAIASIVGIIIAIIVGWDTI